MRAMSEHRVMEMSYNLTKCGHKRNKLAACKLYLNLTLSKILGLFCWSLLPGHRDTSKPAPTSHLLPQLLTSLPRSIPPPAVTQWPYHTVLFSWVSCLDAFTSRVFGLMAPLGRLPPAHGELLVIKVQPGSLLCRQVFLPVPHLQSGAGHVWIFSYHLCQTLHAYPGQQPWKSASATPFY